MTKTEQAYIPGMCNINHAEVAYRKKAMIAGFAIAAVIFFVMFVLGINIYVRAVVTFLPLFVGVIGYFQVKNRFCVSYGASGKQNASEGSDTALQVAEASARQADKKKARTMNVQAGAISLVIIVLSLLVPAL